MLIEEVKQAARLEQCQEWHWVDKKVGDKKVAEVLQKTGMPVQQLQHLKHCLLLQPPVLMLQVNIGSDQVDYKYYPQNLENWKFIISELT